MKVSKEFRPSFFLRHPFVQTVVSSWKLPNQELSNYHSDSVPKLYTTKDQGKILMQEHTSKPTAPLFVFLHGWEGSAMSSYMLRTSHFFEKLGYNTIRINFRDHGNTHHLNEGLFHGGRFPEICEVLEEILTKSTSKEIYLAGFSLGGNFALQFAGHLSKSKKTNLRKKLKMCFAISPALNPRDATEKLDEHPFFRWYFLKAWKKSLKTKEKLFPYLYSFDSYLDTKSVMELTDRIVKAYSSFQDAYEYFLSYTIPSDFFKKLRVPVFILTSADDPIIPVDGFVSMEPHPLLHIQIESWGGHCGFLKNWKRETFFQEWIYKTIQTQDSSL